MQVLVELHVGAASSRRDVSGEASSRHTRRGDVATPSSYE